MSADRHEGVGEVRQSANHQEQLIDTLALRLDNWRLTTPAIAFLETHKPLSFIASQSLLVLQPLLTLFLGDASLEDYVMLLEDRSNVDRFICRLEELQGDLGAAEPAVPGEGERSWRR